MSAALPAVLPIVPFTRPVRGAVDLPGSKSITNRALLLAALCPRSVGLTGALFSEDTHLMAEALRALGCTIAADEVAGTLVVSPPSPAAASPAGDAPITLFVGLAGTAARFLTAFCAARPSGVYHLDGVPQMRKRPMQALIHALRALGADVRCTGAEGFFPLEIHARGLDGGDVTIDASESSQLLSALLMVAPLARGEVRVTLASGVRWSYVEMTTAMMAHFQGTAANRSAESPAATAAPPSPILTRTGERTFVVHPRHSPTAYDLPTGTYAIEPDASAASYFLALPLATGGELLLRGAHDSGHGLQGDTAFADIVRAVGATVNAHPSRAASGDSGRASADDAGLTVSFDPTHTPRLGLDRNFKAISDTFLTLAALSPLLRGPTRITGIAHTRKQETDRVAGMAAELHRLGQDVVEEEDALTITPRPIPSAAEPIVIQTYHDHRFAMSFGVLGCHDLRGDGRPWLAIADPACCAKTFPDFFTRLEALRRASH